MEEWFDETCAEYQVHTVHKRGPREFDRTLYDYWDPFINRLKRVKGDFFSLRIERNECYGRLRTHSLINYYSHAQANPYTWPSIGDVSYLWGEFAKFQKLFDCHSCSRKLKYDPSSERLHCICGDAIFASSS